MSLPKTVIEKDRTLQKSADALMKLRWHWTMDKSNPERTTKAAYAKQVGARQDTVGADARGYDLWLSRGSAGKHDLSPGDCRELAKIGEEKRHAVEAVAKQTGKSVSTVARHDRVVVDAVVGRARDRAEAKGTNVSDEIEVAAERAERARKTAAANKKERKERNTARYIEVEGHVGFAMRRLRQALDATEGVEFSSAERELLSDTLGKLRALLNLIDLRVTGSVDIDWDTEFQKIAT